MFGDEATRSWRLPEYIEHSKELFAWLEPEIADILIPATDRDIASSALYGDGIKFHQAFLTMVENTLYSPAVAILRLEFERVVKGYWLRRYASDSRVRRFLEGKTIKVGNALSEIRENTEKGDLVSIWIDRVNQVSYQEMNNATHVDAVYAFRFYSDERVRQRFEEKEIMRCLVFSHTTLCICGCEVLGIAGNVDSARELQKHLYSSFSALIFKE